LQGVAAVVAEPTLTAVVVGREVIKNYPHNPFPLTQLTQLRWAVVVLGRQQLQTDQMDQILYLAQLLQQAVVGVDIAPLALKAMEVLGVLVVVVAKVHQREAQELLVKVMPVGHPIAPVVLVAVVVHPRQGILMVMLMAVMALLHLSQAPQ
jgi:hypothetical protein